MNRTMKSDYNKRMLKLTSDNIKWLSLYNFSIFPTAVFQVENLVNLEPRKIKLKLLSLGPRQTAIFTSNIAIKR